MVRDIVLLIADSCLESVLSQAVTEIIADLHLAYISALAKCEAVVIQIGEISI